VIYPEAEPWEQTTMPKETVKPALTVDVLVFTVREERLEVLLIRRKNPPFQGSWAIPGGFVDEGEAPPEAAHRELEEETAVRGMELHEYGAFGEPGRDPRGWTVSVAYFALVPARGLHVEGRDDAAEAGWHPADDPPELAFDHALLLERGRSALRERLLIKPLAAPLLPREFTWARFCDVYDILMGKRLDRKQLRKIVLATHLLRPGPPEPEGRRYSFAQAPLLRRVRAR
jgi:8-oxo-dGTP diphosphatase